MTMDDTRVIHLKLNFVQTELPQTSSPSPFSPWPTRAKILAEFCRVFSSKNTSVLYLYETDNHHGILHWHQ